MKRKETNINAFEALQELYENVQISDFTEAFNLLRVSGIKTGIGEVIAFNICGFGTGGCVICRNAGNKLVYSKLNSAHRCDYCVYGIVANKKIACIQHETYRAIIEANTKEKIIKAFRNRANFMKEIKIEFDKLFKL